MSRRSVEEVFGCCSIALVTPFKEEGDEDQPIDFAAVDALVKSLAPHVAGRGALIVAGSTGEGHMMTVEERCSLYQAAARAAQGEALVVAGVAAFRTSDAVRLIEGARAAGCAGIMLGLPPYIRPTEGELEAYVDRCSAAAADLPVLLYDNSPRNGGGPSTASIARMAARGWIGGVKVVGADPSSTVAVATELSAAAPELRLYTGNDVLFGTLRLVSLEPGGSANVLHGLTSILGNVAPRQVLAMAEGESLKEVKAARDRVSLLAAACLSGCSLPSGVKCAMAQTGVAGGVPRAPLRALQDDQKISEITAAVISASENSEL